MTGRNICYDLGRRDHISSTASSDDEISPPLALPRTTWCKSHLRDNVMARQGSDLAISGLLYEGNHTEWRVRVKSALTAHGHEVNKDVTNVITSGRNENAIPAAQVITTLVSPALLARIPGERRNDPNTLLSTLALVARPFPFMRLPPELRVQVYEYHLLPNVPVSDIPTRHRQGSALPSLLQVSRTIRAELLPIFWSQARMWLTLKNQATIDDIDQLIEDLCAWAAKAPKDKLRLIRRISLHIVCDTGKFLHISSMEEGSIDAMTTYIGKDDAETWTKHVAATEKSVKWMGLRGEALVLAFAGAKEVLKHITAT